MIHSRTDYANFLERELKAQNDDFLEKLHTKALQLLEQKGEIFLGQFMGFRGGSLMLSMPSSRVLPRKGVYLNCLLLPDRLRNYHNWADMTYGDLVKRQEGHTEAVCVWYGASNNPARMVVGFQGIDCAFAQRISNARGIVLVLAPHVPPFEYLKNLQALALSLPDDEVLDYDYRPRSWAPSLLDDATSVSQFLLRQLSLTDTVALQGPPGTGKTTVIAQLCAALLSRGASVVVTALTNRALWELAEKAPLRPWLDTGRVAKTNLSTDEAARLPSLRKADGIAAIPGELLLSTFYAASGSAVAAGSCNGAPPFDFAVMDEASQALLPTFAAQRRLARKCVFVGDVRQLAPVVQMNLDRVNQNGWQDIAEGFATICQQTPIPNFQLSVSYRLTPRSARLTALFYEGHLRSAQANPFWAIDPCTSSSYLPEVLGRGLSGIAPGPVLVKTDLPLGQKAPATALQICLGLLRNIYGKSPKSCVAVLSCFVATAKGLTRAISSNGLVNDNLTVETVARVQGLTCDVAVFIIPNTSVFRSLEPHLFNVATSRSRGYTLIVADKSISCVASDPNVRAYLQTLDREASIYLPASLFNSPEATSAIIQKGD